MGKEVPDVALFVPETILVLSDSCEEVKNAREILAAGADRLDSRGRSGAAQGRGGRGGRNGGKFRRHSERDATLQVVVESEHALLNTLELAGLESITADALLVLGVKVPLEEEQGGFRQKAQENDIGD